MLQRTTKTEPASPQDSTLPSYTELAAQNKELAAQNALLLEQNHQMREEIQALRDEVARLKKQKPKPKIGPSKMEGKKNKRGKKRKRRKKPPLRAAETKIVKAKDVPAGSEFNLKFLGKIAIKSL